MCYLDIDDPCPVWSETSRRARQPHKCIVCRRVIYVGEKYTVHFSVYNGETCSEKVCSLCQAARNQFAEAHEGQGYQPNYFVQSLVDCIDEGDEESRTVWMPMLAEIQGRMASRPSRRAAGRLR